MYNFRCSCTLCQLPNEKDFWACQNSSCKGHLSVVCAADLVVQFTKRHENSYQNPSSIAFEESCGIVSVPTIANNSLTCSSCKETVHKSILLSHALEIIHAFQIYKSASSPSPSIQPSSSMEKVNCLLKAYEKAKAYTTATSYCRYEILSSLCLELIGMHTFDRLLPYSEELCALASSIYPYRHPQVSVFYLQHTKLLKYLYGYKHKDFHRFFERAKNCLQISHPSCHDIFTVLYDISQ